MAFNFCIFFFIFLSLELIYFRIANRYGVIDKPNMRSSHAYSTIRGGGIIFPLSCFLVPIISFFDNWFAFSISLAIISTISFLDDLIDLNSKLRLIIQSVAVVLILFQFRNLFPLYGLIMIFIVFTGIINAYNFMDGINGITAIYSIATIVTLYWINNFIIVIAPDLLFLSVLSSLIVFSVFNLRVKAKCFAGDVGSVSMAFIICFLILVLSIKTKSYLWLLLLGVYGIDTVVTICCRISRKEVLFKAHRSHFYQFLANERKLSHVLISSSYGLAQLVLNLVIITGYELEIPWLAVTALFVFLLIYLIFRFRYEGRDRLFIAY